MMETRACLRVRVRPRARTRFYSALACCPLPPPRLFLFLTSQRHRLPPLLMALVLQDGEGGL